MRDLETKRAWDRASYAENPEPKREQARAWRLANPERLAATKAAYRENNRERLRAEARERHRLNPLSEEQLAKRRLTSAAWQKAHPEVERERRRRWRQAHPESNAETLARRRARLRGVEVEAVDRAAIIARDKQRCHLCGKRVAKAQITIDHIIPLSLGGPHTAANLAVAHALCNARKGARAANDQLRLIG